MLYRQLQIASGAACVAALDKTLRRTISSKLVGMAAETACARISEPLLAAASPYLAQVAIGPSCRAR